MLINLPTGAEWKRG